MSNNIKLSDLPKIWAAPDNSRLISKQISVRLPVHVAAKIYALEHIYTNRTRTQIINDLLASALEDIGESMPSKKGREIGELELGPEQGYSEYETLIQYEEVGTRAKFYKLYNQYLYDLEKELGNEGEIQQIMPLVLNEDELATTTSTKK